MHKIEKVNLPNVKHIIAVASGKGGVGKSTVAANLALAFAQNGYKTALVDADLFGPSVPTMFGISGNPLMQQNINGKDYLLPIDLYGIKLMSVGFMVKADEALIWRGPMASSVLLQLFGETHWGEIDYMIVDLPPGTGDIPLTLCQQVDVDGVVIVTTPQQMALIDVRKAISMFQNPDLKRNILGVVENMSWFTPIQHPDEKYFLFGKGGGEKIANETNTELLAQIPLIDGMVVASDEGRFYGFPQGKMIQNVYNELIDKLIKKVQSTKTQVNKSTKMKKIAAPVTNAGQIDDHFGHCEFYNVYTISETNEITGIKRINSEEGCGCKSNIASVLASQGVSLMLAGGIGGGAIDVLNKAGVEVIRGCSGNVEEVVKSYLAGLIADSGESCKAHEEHHKEGSAHVCSH